MPTYDYSCEQCNKKIEVFKKFSDTSEVNCPECGSKMQRLISGFSINFKGGGFYVNDISSSASKGSTNSSEHSPTSDSSSSNSSATSDNSSASKSEGSSTD